MPSKREISVRRSRKAAILSKCHDCCGQYMDGKQDCGVRKCPLYPFMPYRKRKPIFNWAKYSPKRVGKVTWEEVAKGSKE